VRSPSEKDGDSLYLAISSISSRLAPHGTAKPKGTGDPSSQRSATRTKYCDLIKEFQSKRTDNYSYLDYRVLGNSEWLTGLGNDVVHRYMALCNPPRLFGGYSTSTCGGVFVSVAQNPSELRPDPREHSIATGKLNLDFGSRLSRWS
jgi:hypothetical protein